MPAPVLTWYDSGDVAQATSLTFAPENGVATAAQTVHLWNDKGGTAGSDDATELHLTCYTRDQGDTTWSQTHDAAAYGWVRCQAVGSGGPGAPVAHLTGLASVGLSRQLNLLDLPSDGYRSIEVSVLVPAGVGTQAIEVLLVARYAEVSESLPDGAFEAGGMGVRSGLGDTTASWIVTGGAITESGGGADANANVAAVWWVHEGIPLCIDKEAVALNQNDVTPAALTAGRAYWATLSLGAAGTVTVTKGAAAASASATKAAVPAGELPLGHVKVPYQAGTSVISTADITQADRLFGGFAAVTSGASLSVTLHPGSALIGGRLVTISGTRSVTLGATDETWIWLTPAGATTTSLDAIAPVDRALLLYRMTTDGSGVTIARDCRSWIGRPLHSLRMLQEGTLAANDYTNTIVYPGRTPGRVRPVAGLQWSLGDNGASSGSTKLDVEVSDAGGAWTSLFPSSATTDLRPTIAHDSTDPTSESTTETLTIPARCRLRCKVIAIPGTASTDLDAVLLVEEAG